MAKEALDTHAIESMSRRKLMGASVTVGAATA
jgi:hypothetical protein